MTEEKYRKWDEIVNPALERTRRKQKSDPFEDEIARAIGIDSEEKEGQGDVWTDQGNESDDEVPSNRYGTERISDRRRDQGTAMAGGGESALDRWGKASTPQREEIDDPADRQEDASARKEEYGEDASDRREDKKPSNKKEAGGERSLDRWESGSSHRGGESEPALDRWSTREVPDHREREHSYAIDMTEAEREEYLEKRRKLKSIMGEFVDWKESME